MFRIALASLCFGFASPALAHNPSVGEHGSLLFVWIGGTHSQTLTITPFEGENASERCEAALSVLKSMHRYFNDDWVRCEPF